MRSARLLVLLASLVVIIAGVLALLFWRHPELLGVHAGSEEQSSGLFWTVMLGSALVLMLGLYRFLGSKSGQFDYRASSADDMEPAAQVVVDPLQAAADNDLIAIRNHLPAAHGFAWRSKVRLLLVVGEQDEVDAIAPGLSTARWLEGEGVLLLYGGSMRGLWRTGVVGVLKELRPGHPLDGVVWALSEGQSASAQALSDGVRQLHGLARSLRWQAPLYLWQVRGSDWQQYERTLPAIGCLLAPNASAGWVAGVPAHAAGATAQAGIGADEFGMQSGFPVAPVPRPGQGGYRSLGQDIGAVVAAFRPWRAVARVAVQPGATACWRRDYPEHLVACARLERHP